MGLRMCWPSGEISLKTDRPYDLLCVRTDPEIKQSGISLHRRYLHIRRAMESANKSVDMDSLKQKVEAGCDFL